jgi:hypothetical protein
MLAIEENFSLLCILVNWVHKKFYNIEPSSQCFKTFYGRNLRLPVKSLSVCPWQSGLMFVGNVSSQPYSGAPERGFTWVGSSRTRKH